MIVVLFGLMYFFMIRPQRKQEQKRREELSKVKPGDQVVTIGRLHGIVDEVNTTDKTVTLDCDGIYLVFDLNAIASIKQPAVGAPVASDRGNQANAAAKPAEPKDNVESSQPAATDEKPAAEEPDTKDSEETK
ncbi:preprotein translocase subunit YajC [Lentilactobacillus curieae]